MISAFGVDHGGISKSLVDGVFKPASKLTGAERRAVGGYKKLRGVTSADNEHRAGEKHIKDYHSDRNIRIGVKTGKVTQGKQGTVRRYKHSLISSQVPVGAGGFHIRTGSAKEGTSYVHLREGADKSTKAHELAHARPARSGYRMAQIVKDPKKLMREEARADFESRGHFAGKKTDSGYAQAAKERSRQTAGKAHEEKLRKVPGGRTLARIANGPTATKSESYSNHVAEALNKPEMGHGPVDQYVKVQNQMHQAKHGTAPPKVTPRSVHAAYGVAGASAASAAGGGYALHDHRKKLKLRTANG